MSRYVELEYLEKVPLFHQRQQMFQFEIHIYFLLDNEILTPKSYDSFCTAAVSHNFNP